MNALAKETNAIIKRKGLAPTAPARPKEAQSSANSSLSLFFHPKNNATTPNVAENTSKRFTV